MLILPTDNKEKARTLLDQAITDKFTITMLVLGDGQGEDQIASKADVRAHALASTRLNFQREGCRGYFFIGASLFDLLNPTCEK